MARRRQLAELLKRGVGAFPRHGDHGLLRGPRVPIHQVHDRAPVFAHDSRVRLGGEVAHGRRMPVVPPRQAARLVHALLHHGPLARRIHHERMQVDLEPIGDGVVVHLRREPAGADQRFPIQAPALGYHAQFLGRVARVPAAPAADIEPQLVRARVEPALQRPHHGGGDAGGVPVHAHHRTEGLEPERVAEAGKEFRRAVVVQDALGDGRAQPGHAVGEPGRHMPAMQRQVGVSRAFHASDHCSRSRAPTFHATM